jgi:hypothetical protein
MYPIIDSVTFVTHDKRHVSVANEGGDTITCSWPLCDDKLPTSFLLSAPTHLDFDERMLRRLATQVRARCVPEEVRQLGMGDSIDAYFQILRRLIP